MRQAAFGMALLLVAGVLAGCTAGTKDKPIEISDPTLATTMCAAAGMSPTMSGVAGCAASGGAPPTSKLKLALTVSGGAWVAPGTTLDASIAPPADATGAITYIWAWGPMGGTVPITSMKKTQTSYVSPGQSESIVFDAAGVFYEHCHPHPWMRSNVTILDDGRPPITTTVHFIDGVDPSRFHFSPENLVLPKGSTVVYQNDGNYPHQTMLLQQDAPITPLKQLTGSTGQVKADGTGWMRVVVYTMDTAGHFGSAEHDVYVAPIPQPFADKFGGMFNVTVPSASPVPPPGPLQESPQTHAFTAERAGRIFLNFTSQDAVAANAPTDPAGDMSSIQIDIMSKDGATKVATAKGDKGSIDAAIKGGDHVVKVTVLDGELVTYAVTMSIVYDLVPPTPAPYADPSEQIVMGGGMKM